MRCPFIREAAVRSCAASAVRKLIPGTAADAGDERCSTAAYALCPGFTGSPEGEAASRCPHLQEMLVEYCSAAAVTKYIPATEGLLPRCKSERHRYCELFIRESDPLGERLTARARVQVEAVHGPHVPVVNGIAVPGELSYSPNHMWLDVAEDGCCHVGVDAFLAWVVGAVERISFAAARAVDRPVAVLAVNGVDLQLVFPRELEGIVPNSHLRTSPAKLTADPYGAGWLFEGSLPTHLWSAAATDSQPRLLRGEEATWWVASETDRLTTYVHDHISRPGPAGGRVMADGGRVEAGVAAHLSRDELVTLFNEFFPPVAGSGRSW